ncbi:hypothetical protein C206_20851 [Pseudomonas putida TRO1]|uniref:Uncharacterized protein n=1 Tax=Pseudomonas putida TRO1 TaxID=1227924 RepID=A0AAD2W7N0_PSEPU|nr:hypothetical protein [Pseudomonas putida]ENY75654.1 hypothetical protein C206_20851 [Pseudomonas putida TRO1]
MPTDCEKFKALAEAAGGVAWAWWTSNSTLRLTTEKDGRHGADGDALSAHGDNISCPAAYREFIAALHPAAVLALLAESEALRKEGERNKRMLLDACVSIGSIGEALGLDMDADADMMIGTARDLIDGLNRIIKECPLGSPGFAITTEVMGELGVQQEVQP